MGNNSINTSKSNALGRPTQKKGENKMGSMPNFGDNRMITVEGGAIPKQANGNLALRPMGIKGEEALSTAYAYQLDLVTPIDMEANEAANLDLEAMVGREVTVTIHLDGMSLSVAGIGSLANIGAGTRQISGIATGATLLEQQERNYIYRLVIEPWIVLAKRRSDYRIFQRKSVVEIIDEVLNSQYIYSYEKRLSQQYPALEYEVQYGESDYHFIQRLMERSGIYWFFEHSGGVHRMVLIDRIEAHRPVASEAYRVLPYYPPEQKINRESIDHFDITERIQSGSWVTDDFDFTRPQSKLTAQKAQPKQTPYNQLAIYEWPGNYMDLTQGGEYARIRMEDIRARSQHASGRGSLRNVVCGTTFTLSDYPHASANCEYLVIRAKLEAEERGETSNSGEFRFNTTFDVQPTSIPYRPERKTIPPRTKGPQTAIVTGPPGQEIWTDQYGRVKLKFHWDRSPTHDQNSSCWVRVSYPWAGSNFGGVNIPRVGTEVIVDFENGDPNRPIVTGRVYNAATMPPWQLPGNATQSGLISRSIGGGIKNANALRFEDLAGLEEIWLQAERDMLTQIKNNEVHGVGANRSKNVGGNELSNISGTRTETVAGDEKIDLQANRDRSVGKDDKLNVQGEQKTTIKGNQHHEVQGNHDRITGRDDSLSVSGSQKVSIQKDQTLNVSGDQSIKIEKDQRAEIGKTYSIKVQDKFEVKVGSSSLTLESNGNISITGASIKIDSSGPVRINGEVIDLN